MPLPALNGYTYGETNGYTYGETLMWKRCVDEDTSTQFTPEADKEHKPLNAKALAHELEDVDPGKCAGTEICLAQYLSVDRRVLD